MSKDAFTDNVRQTISNRLLNEEYQRGYRIGQEDAIARIARLIDEMLGQYNHIAKHFPINHLRVTTTTDLD